MTISLADMFDEYALRARIYPGLLASLPLVITVLLLWPDPGLKALWAIVVAAGGTFFLANYVRSRGKKLEVSLVDNWDGLPTTHMLRHREVENPVMFRRRRQGLQRVFGEPLPTPDEERSDPSSADAVYIAATRALISRVRSDASKYPRVHDENIQYGFRRNLLALKSTSLITLVILIAADLAASIIHFRPGDLVALGLNLIIGLAWLRVVDENWVREAGQSYAERLFETLDQDGLTLQ
jgi:hypothetical protein